MQTSIIPNISSAVYVIPGIKNVKLELQKGGIELFFEIRDKVCNFYSVDVNLIYKKNRKREVCMCRQVIAYLARMYTTLSLNVLACEFKKDHTSIMYMVRAMNNLLETDENIRRDVEYMKKII